MGLTAGGGQEIDESHLVTFSRLFGDKEASWHADMAYNHMPPKAKS